MGSTRIVGQRRHDQHLLSMVNGKAREKLSQKVADDAEPISSGDEDNGERPPNGSASLPEPESSESEPERVTRGQIKRTTFGKANSRRTGSKSKSYSEARDSIAEEFEDTASTRLKRRRLDEAGSRQSSPAVSQSRLSPHLDDHSFVKRRPTAATYSKRKEASSQELKLTKGKAKAVRRPKTPDELSTPKKSSKTMFIKPEDDLLASPSTKATFRTIKSRFDVSSSDLDNSNSSGPKAVFKMVESPSQSSSISTKRKPTGIMWGKGSSDAPVPKVKIEKAKKPLPQRAKFVMPSELPPSSRESQDDVEAHADAGVDVDALLSDLSSLSSESSPLSDLSEIELSDIEDCMAECPWCGDSVAQDLLKEFSKGKRLNVRMQTKFCRQHKRDSAMDIWRERHYPIVEWSSLEDRFTDHRDFLLRVVDGESSHFRAILAEKIESGQAARSLKKEDNLNPGYYGPRGFNVMCDYLVNEFGEMLKEKAVSDRVIAGRGSAAFIQSVLVAELAVRLIEEDMGVSSREAREIMEESKALGEMINEEI